MTDTPPFAPPYKTIQHTPSGIHVVETLVDGSTRVVDAVAGDAAAKQLDSGTHPKRVPTVQVKASGNRRAVIYLEVPFAEKDKAKSEGAKWDATKRMWYAPHGIDINQFKRWWPEVLKQEMDQSGIQ